LPWCTHYALHNVGRWISLAKDGGIVPKSNKMFKNNPSPPYGGAPFTQGSLSGFVQLFIFEFSTWLFRQSEAHP
ncbi:MAG: hypothetical protein IKM00_04385, partial [Clostridia bacterium]|nr:hypothetical protein [Clostridia bacterium]